MLNNKNFIKYVVTCMSFTREILKCIYGHLSITVTFDVPVTVRYIEVSLHKIIKYKKKTFI